MFRSNLLKIRVIYQICIKTSLKKVVCIPVIFLKKVKVILIVLTFSRLTHFELILDLPSMTTLSLVKETLQGLGGRCKKSDKSQLTITSASTSSPYNIVQKKHKLLQHTSKLSLKDYLEYSINLDVVWNVFSF